MARFFLQEIKKQTFFEINPNSGKPLLLPKKIRVRYEHPEANVDELKLAEAFPLDRKKNNFEKKPLTTKQH